MQPIGFLLNGLDLTVVLVWPRCPRNYVSAKFQLTFDSQDDLGLTLAKSIYPLAETSSADSASTIRLAICGVMPYLDLSAIS
jgi:hypothetical protein